MITPTRSYAALHLTLLLGLGACAGDDKGDAGATDLPPTAPSVSITPAEPTTSDSLSANITSESEDPEGNQLTYSFSWTADGVEMGTDSNMASSQTAKNETWRVMVTASDGVNDSEAGSAEVVIVNTPPELLSLSIEPAAPSVGDDLTLVITSTDGDNDPVSYLITWTADEIEQSDLSNAETVPSSSTNSGEVWTAVVTPTDGQESGEAMEVSTLVGNNLPVLESVSLSPTEPVASDTLTGQASGMSDVDGDDITLKWEWYINDSLSEEAESSTSSATLGQSLAKGWTIYARVTPNDGWADGDSVISNEVTVGNTPPTIDSATLTPTDPTVTTGITLSANTSDPDGDSITLSVAWSVNGSTVSETGETLTSDFERGDTVFATVMPYDGSDYGAGVVTDSVTVANAVPSASNVVIQPSTPSASDSLSGSVVGWSDADGDDEGYDYQWYLNGAAISTATSALLDSGYTTVGDEIYLTATPNDGIDTGSTVTSSVVTISNSAPVASASTVDGNTSVTQCDEVYLDGSGSTDADGDTLAYSWSISAQPSDSSITDSNIDSVTDMQPTVVPDAAGTYTFVLAVSDGTQSDIDTIDIDVAIATSNNDPVADAGEDMSGSGLALCSEDSSYGWSCAFCTGDTYVLDGSASADVDGQELTYTWSTNSSYATIDDPTAEVTTMTVANLPTTYGEVISTSFNVTLRVEDCANGSDETYISFSYTCEGI